MKGWVSGVASLVGGVVLGHLVVRGAPNLGLFFFVGAIVIAIVLGFCGLGAWLGARAAAKRDSSTGGRVACWANVVAWLFPPLGLFTSTYVLAMHKDSWTSRKAVTGLASVCLVLSLINGAVGARGGVETARDRAAARDGRTAPSVFGGVTPGPVDPLGGPSPTQTLPVRTPLTLTPPTQTPPTQPRTGQDASSFGDRAKVVGSSDLPEGFGAVAVDPRNKRVFVSSPLANSVAVLDFDGKFQRTISGVPGAASLLVEGNKLFVAATTAGRIEVFDTKSLERREVLGQGALVSPGPLAMAGGRLWTSTGSCGGSGTKLVAIDLASKAVVDHPLDGTSSYCVGMATSPTDPNVLLTFEPGLSPATITRLDVSAPVPSVVKTQLVSELGNLKQLAVLPSGQTFVSASGSPYRIDRFRLSDLAEDGFRYATGTYPNAVVATAGGGGLIAAGRDAAYDPDIDIFAADDPSRKFFSHDFGMSRTLLDQGLAWSPDGRRLFAVDGQREPNSVRLTAFDVAPG